MVKESTDNRPILDLVFVQDATGSMGDYIESAKNSIVEICSVLRASGRLRSPDGLQVGLVAYRDYNEGEDSFLCKPYPFTSDIQVIQQHLANLNASGGGDAPEALSTALEYAYDMDGWRDDAVKAIVVVTDAPPHGIKEDGDDYPDGAPKGERVEDPLRLAHDMAGAQYSIFTLACEPTLSKQFRYTVDFYKALSDRTLGKFCSLTDHNMLPAYIIGALLEKLDLRKLSMEYQAQIKKMIFEDHMSIDEVVRKLHEEFKDKKLQATNLQSGDIYRDVPDANENYKIFATSDTLVDAKRRLIDVGNGARISDKDFKAIQKHQREVDGARDLLIVIVRFKNLGKGRIEIQTFDANLRAMYAEDVVPHGGIVEKRFRINVPVNFTLTLGRSTKTFSRTFIDDDTIDVYQFFD